MQMETRGRAQAPDWCQVVARDQRLKNARVENSSMLDRLPRDGSSEIARRRFKVSQVSKFQGLWNLENVATL